LKLVLAFHLEESEGQDRDRDLALQDHHPSVDVEEVGLY
jgi:hypothetical protein